MAFSLDLQQLAAIAGPDALAGFDFVDDIADVINPGAAGKINLSAFVNFRVQAGIRLVDGGPEFFLYDYNPTRIETRSVAAFGAVVFDNRSSVLSDDSKAAILADFRRVVGQAGEGVQAISALVNTYWITPTEGSDTQDNIDDVHGAGQLAGRRQSEIVELQDWLSAELGVTVQLFAGEQSQIEQGGATATFTGVEIDREVAVSAEKARGTAASIGLRVAGQDLELGFEAGPARLGVTGGWAAIDRDGLASTKDYATFALTLDQRGGTLADDGRFYIGPERLSNNVGYEIVGAMGMDLPISLSVSGLPDIKLSSFTATTGPAGVQGLLDMAAGRLVQGKVIDIKVPNVQDVMDNFLGEFSLLGMLTDPSRILDGIDSALGVVQDLMSEELARDIPVIGDKMAAAGNFVRDVRVGFLEDLRTKLSSEGGTVPILQSSLWDLFGTDGLNIILDKDGNNVVDLNDIDIIWVDRDGVTLSNWVKGDLPPSAADAIQIDMDLGMKLLAADIDIPLDFEVPGFSLDVDGGFTFDLGWAWDFGFGISTSSGFYLKTNTDDTKEIRVQADAFLQGVNGQPFTAVGSLLFFDVTVTDALPDGNRSGASAVLGVDIVGDARGRLPVTKLFSQSPSQTFNVGFDVTSKIDLQAQLEVKDVKAMPKLRANLTVDWNWSYGERLMEPTIELVNLRLDVGSMINDFLLPISEQIAGILDPFAPFVEMMVTPINGLDFIEAAGIQPTPLGLINGILKIQGKPQIPQAFFDAVLFMHGLPDTLSSWATTGEIILGDIVGLGAGTLRAIPSISASSADLDAKFAELESKSSGGSSKTTVSSGKINQPRSGFKMLEYLKNIENWKSIMSGGDAILFSYEMPLLGFGANASVPIARVPIGPVMIGVDGVVSFSAIADLAFGYDTYGIRQAINSGNPSGCD